MAAPRPIRRLAAVLCTGLVVAACGPRFDVAELEGTTTGTSTVQVPLAGGQVADGPTTADPATSGPADDAPGAGGVTTPDAGSQPGTTPGTTPESTGGSAGTGSDAADQDAAGDTDEASNDAGGGQPAAPQQPAAGEDPGPAPGVTDEPCPGDDGGPVNEDLGCIRIGVLVPETGAAPVPSDFRSGVSLYWYEKAAAGGTHGRGVELVVADTTSQPNTATNQAQQLLQQGVFTIVSLDRLEVHEALGNFMERAGVPHVMVQAPTPAPASWVNTFIISIDHTAQGRAVARYWADDLKAGQGKRPVGFVREQTSALKPGTDEFEREAKTLGLDVVTRETIDPSQTSFTQTVLRVCQSGAEIVWLYMAPTPALTFMQQAATQNCNPIWFANSISWNLDLAQSNPAAPADSRAFSPWVSLQSSRAADYRAAYAKYNNGNADDLGLAAWGLNEVIDSALEAVGPNLGRDSFRSAFEQLNATYDVWGPIDCRGGAPYVCTNKVAVYDDDGTGWKIVGDFRDFG